MQSDTINYGYACANMQLYYPKLHGNCLSRPLSTNRTMIKKTFLERGVSYASELALKNCIDLFTIIKWNKINNFNFFRVSSNLFPWSSEYNLKDLPDFNMIKKTLTETGAFINKNNMRITSHPGPFNVLTSPNEKVVKNCIKDLSVQGETFDLMNLERTPFNKINIHIGGAYNNKKDAMKRFCKNFKRLPVSVQKRLTVENDDRSTLYSVKDLYNGVYKKIKIPIVFDYHHHRFCDGNMSEKEALELAISTWNGIKPVVHYSESRSEEKKDNTIKPQAHSDYVYQKINTYGNIIDIMVEAKYKELAVIEYLKKHKN
tara:strand:+ start:14 stop:961 length:948 start_codon:yes stop_codon:yes gene_type:complete